MSASGYFASSLSMRELHSLIIIVEPLNEPHRNLPYLVSDIIHFHFV